MDIQQTPMQSPAGHATRVIQELKAAGASPWAMWHSEAAYVPRIIHPDEHIGGMVYGYMGATFVYLLATDRRIICLDRKPLFTNQDEITYDVVSGVNYHHVGYSTTVILHTRVKDYNVMTFNTACALQFVSYIEQRCLEHAQENSTRATNHWIHV